MATILYTKPLDTPHPLHTFILSAQELYLTQLAQESHLTVSHCLVSDTLKTYAINGPTPSLLAFLTQLATYHVAGIVISLAPDESPTLFEPFNTYHSFAIQQ